MLQQFFSLWPCKGFLEDLKTQKLLYLLSVSFETSIPLIKKSVLLHIEYHCDDLCHDAIYGILMSSALREQRNDFGFHIMAKKITHGQL